MFSCVISVFAFGVSVVALVYSAGFLPFVVVKSLGISVQDEFERLFNDNSKLRVVIANRNNRDLLLCISGYCVIEGRKYEIDEQYHSVTANSLNDVFLRMSPAGDKISGMYDSNSKTESFLCCRFSKHGRFRKYSIVLRPANQPNGKPNPDALAD